MAALTPAYQATCLRVIKRINALSGVARSEISNAASQKNKINKMANIKISGERRKPAASAKQRKRGGGVMAQRKKRAIIASGEAQHRRKSKRGESAGSSASSAGVAGKISVAHQSSRRRINIEIRTRRHGHRISIM